MKASDYVAEFLQRNGVTVAFGMSGGAIIHLVDSLYHKTNICVISGSHEQYSAFEADGWSRAQDLQIPGVCFATSGPGATNLITGIASSYYDSIPIIVFTGQVARHRQRGNLNVRQFGFQELPSAEVIAHLVKATYKPRTGQDLIHCLRDAWKECLSGRPGPVHIDLADDLQRDDITVDDYMYLPYENEDKVISGDLHKSFELVSTAKKVLVLVGSGARSSKPLLRTFLLTSKFACVSTWAGIDLASGLENYIGVIGTYSPSYNYLLEECDLIISLGCRLSNNIIGSNPSDFAPFAKKIIVDIDDGELSKIERLNIIDCLLVQASCSDYLNELLNHINWSSVSSTSNNKTVFDVGEIRRGMIVNKEIDLLQSVISSSVHKFRPSGIFLDTGNNLSWSCNILSTLHCDLPGIYSSWNNTPMGFSVPAAIGYCLGKHNQPVIAIIGDGGLGICLSELFLISRMNLPIMVVLVENGGHNIQKQTIETWLESAYAVVDEDTGLYIPSYEGLGEFVGIPSIGVHDAVSLGAFDAFSWDQESPVIIHVKLSEDARSFPIVPFGRRLTDPLSL